ncbi:TRAP transporter small permease [Ferrovibrio sp.]|uniref:TRAP transporter small permease n=1 Tax=Ferrovibrio sp. TaxID=1917215 RepID=UPI0035B34A6F
MEAITSRVLSWMFRCEVVVACGALLLVAGALLSDVIAREVLGNGLFGAQRFAVFCNAVGGLLGFAIVVHTGGHLRVAVVDQLFPAHWHSAMARIGDLLSCALCLLLMYYAYVFVGSTYTVGDTDAVFNIKIWPIQSVLIYLFAASALRYLCYAFFPALRPAESENMA